MSEKTRNRKKLKKTTGKTKRPNAKPNKKKKAEVVGHKDKWFRFLAENIREVFWIGSSDWQEVHYISPAYEEIWGLSCKSLYDDPMSWMGPIFQEDRAKVIKTIESVAGREITEVSFPEYRIMRPDGSVRWIYARAFPYHDQDGNIKFVTGIAEDITKRKQTELALLKEKLKLEETNIALKIILRESELTKDELEKNVLINIKNLLLPYLAELEAKRPSKDQQFYLNIIKTNLEEVCSSFSRKIKLEYTDLTPREMQVASLIKQGRTNKEIAKLLNITANGVDFHRRNLREKFNIKGKKTNLRSHLLSFVV